ncbi:uncharacterized protein LOC113464815 [Ceratina calcarata]|uniref:Uncharacterized protein LOC113464815 n=1 Tax=Ceratina calcarata TaxID=156304 RepID=A0AAJ7WET6_9HYME|nr:uncharacterized protein LOC113464815 [Ceratina calcarata]
MEILLNWDVDIDTIVDGGNTALHLASRANQYEAVRTLIANDCNVNIVNDKQKTALHLYCSKYGSMDRLSMIQELLIKMEVASLNMNNGNVENLNITTDLSKQYVKFQKKCIEEIRRMKSTKIKNTVITFHDILTKRIDQIALYARNEDVVQVMEGSDYQTMFPTYEDIIKRRFNRGILKYLSNWDLTNLKNACK